MTYIFSYVSVSLILPNLCFWDFSPSKQNLTYFLNKTTTNMNKNLNFSFKGKQGQKLKRPTTPSTFVGFLFLSSAVGLNSAGCGVQWKHC